MTRDQALDWIRIRCLLTRRIVPFLVHEQRERGGAPGDIAHRLGLREEDVLAYIEEIEREVRAMGAGGYSTGETTPTCHG